MTFRLHSANQIVGRDGTHPINYEQYTFRHDTRDKRHVMNDSRAASASLSLYLFSDLAMSTINVAGRNRLCAQHKETFRQQICAMLTQPQAKKNN